MPSDPLLLRVRGADDEARQLHAHRVNAVADALHHTILHTPIRPPARVPYASARVDVIASELTARIAIVKVRVADLEAAHGIARPGSPERATYALVLDRQAAYLARLEADAQERERRSLPARPPGTSGHYTPHVPTVTVIREDGTQDQIEGFTGDLDTRELPDALRDRLKVYLLSGARARPYRYKAEQQRLYPRDGVPDDDLNLLHLLTSHMLPSAPGVTRAEPLKSA